MKRIGYKHYDEIKSSKEKASMFNDPKVSFAEKLAICDSFGIGTIQGMKAKR